MTSMVAVHIVGLQLDPESGIPVVLLAADPVTRVLPIIIGGAEAQSIALAAAGVVLPRPGTHDLMIDLLEHVDCRLEEVAVTELTNGTFFAELFVETPAGLRRISARPSDGIALAVRAGVPIFVNAQVLDDAGIDVLHEIDKPFSEEEIESIVEEFQQGLASVQPSDFDIESSDDSDSGVDEST